MYDTVVEKLLEKVVTVRIPQAWWQSLHQALGDREVSTYVRRALREKMEEDGLLPEKDL